MQNSEKRDLGLLIPVESLTMKISDKLLVKWQGKKENSQNILKYKNVSNTFILTLSPTLLMQARNS